MLITDKQRSYENLISYVSGLKRQKGALPDICLFSQDTCLIFFTLFNVFFRWGKGRGFISTIWIYSVSRTTGTTTYPSIKCIGYVSSSSHLCGRVMSYPFPAYTCSMLVISECWNSIVMLLFITQSINITQHIIWSVISSKE